MEDSKDAGRSEFNSSVFAVLLVGELPLLWVLSNNRMCPTLERVRRVVNKPDTDLLDLTCLRLSLLPH
jgi:hypothetical protein